LLSAQLQTTELAAMQPSAQPARSSRQQPATNFALHSDFRQQLSQQQYREAFASVKDYISAGDCYQVNLSQQFQAECTGAPLAAYLQLRRCNPAPFSAFLNWDSGALMSLSPERFLRKQDNAVLTQPIKGTRPRSPDAATDASLARQLLDSEKDRAENLMIVDLLRNDLGKVCKIGSVRVEQLFELQSFSGVHHLVSSVSGELATGRNALDLLANCFPGGSITGAPKLRAMLFIQ
jgi:para-aminobenzoate synthetase component 1